MARMEANDFYCVECGRKGIPIVRKHGYYREAGHLKKLYCLCCQTETNHAEIKVGNANYTYDDFLLEFTLGRFKDGQRVDFKNLEPSSEKCHFCRDGKCWNANGSHHCEKRKEVL